MSKADTPLSHLPLLDPVLIKPLRGFLSFSHNIVIFFLLIFMGDKDLNTNIIYDILGTVSTLLMKYIPMVFIV